MRRLLMIQDLYKQKRSLELKWQQEHLDNNRYTLEMVKIDDKDFQATNPGVWCHRLHNLMDEQRFTNWEEYKNDKIVDDN